MSEQQGEEPDPENYHPTSDLPKAKIEPPDPPPGGPHAVPGVGGDGAYSSLGRDPDPHHNPNTEHDLPEETTEPDDTDTEATKDEEAEVDAAKESSA